MNATISKQTHSNITHCVQLPDALAAPARTSIPRPGVRAAAGADAGTVGDLVGVPEREDDALAAPIAAADVVTGQERSAGEW